MPSRYSSLQISLLSLSFTTITALAAPSGSAPDSGKNTGLEAALSACASSVKKDSQGRPERSAMDSCMQGKGFTRPSGPPPNGTPPAPR